MPLGDAFIHSHPSSTAMCIHPFVLEQVILVLLFFFVSDCTTRHASAVVSQDSVSRRIWDLLLRRKSNRIYQVAPKGLITLAKQPKIACTVAPQAHAQKATQTSQLCLRQVPKCPGRPVPGSYWLPACAYAACDHHNYLRIALRYEAPLFFAARGFLCDVRRGYLKPVRD